MRVPPPTTISPQAQAILRDATEIVGRSTELAVIHQRRKASAAAYVPAGLRLALDLGVTLSEEMIAGVPTQVLKPANIVGNSAILYFFGGGYVQGSPDEDLAITARLAHLTKRPVYAPYYALAPEHPFPQGRDKGLAVYRALAAHFGAHALTVGGESAGGGLALSLLLGLQPWVPSVALDPQIVFLLFLIFLERERRAGQMIALDGGQHLAWQTPDVTGMMG